MFGFSSRHASILIFGSATLIVQSAWSVETRRPFPVDLMGGEAIAVDPNYKGKGLQLSLTVDDPKVFTTAWSARSTFQRSLYPFREWICAENRTEYYSGHDTAVPTADTPDF